MAKQRAPTGVTVKLFVDTSAFVAAAVTSEGNHHRATAVLGDPDARLITSSVVLTEVWTVVRRAHHRHVAERVVAGIVKEGVEVEAVGRGDVLRAMDIGEEFPDQDFSLADRTSFAVMHRLGLYRVATFDHHFAIYRFGPGRRKAFEIAR